MLAFYLMITGSFVFQSHGYLWVMSSSASRVPVSRRIEIIAGTASPRTLLPTRQLETVGSDVHARISSVNLPSSSTGHRKSS